MMKEIKEGMTPHEIADIVSDKLIDIIKKQFNDTKNKLMAEEETYYCPNPDCLHCKADIEAMEDEEPQLTRVFVPISFEERKPVLEFEGTFIHRNSHTVYGTYFGDSISNNDEGMTSVSYFTHWLEERYIQL